MHRLNCFFALLIMANGLSSVAAGQAGAATTVIASPSTITVGGTVQLTATVQPTTATITPGQNFTKPTGSVTFLDGNTPLNASPTALLPDTFSDATFQQVFGALNPGLPTINEATPGELAGDLNGDGLPDLLVYSVQPSPLQTFTLYTQSFISNGKGGYTPAVLQTFSALNVINVPLLIDLNGDGKLDLLNGLQVAYGNGDGTFAAETPVPFLASGFDTAFAADLNGDGKTDLLAVNTSRYPNLNFSYTVLLNAGGGSFISAGTIQVAPGEMLLAEFPPAFYDLNGDGKLDLIVQWNSAPAGVANVAVSLNNGDGTFAAPSLLTVPTPSNIILAPCPSYETGAGDVNGDGKQDLVLMLCDVLGDTAGIIYQGNGDGTFKAPSVFALPMLPNVTVAVTPNFVLQDANLDGKLDLVFGSGWLALGNGDGTFTFASPLFPPLTSAPYSVPFIQIVLAGNSVPSLVYLFPTGTPETVAVFTPQTSSSAELRVSTLAVGTHSVTARYSGDTRYPADTSAAVPVMVTQAVSSTVVKSSVNPSFAGQSVTLTAGVTSNGPVPSGSVTFTSGPTTLGTVALAGGTAAYTTSSFDQVGTLTITASYSGDVDTQPSSTVLSQVINPAFTLEPGGNGSTTLTVQAGQTVSAPINVTGAAGFSGKVTFACSGLPANASCSFSPATITVSGPPAVPTLLTVNTVGSAAMAQLTKDPSKRIRSVAYGMGLAAMVLFWPIRPRRAGRLSTMLLCALAFVMVGMAGCNGSSGSSKPPTAAPGTYNITVTATSGSVQAHSSYTVVVQ